MADNADGPESALTELSDGLGDESAMMAMVDTHPDIDDNDLHEQNITANATDNTARDTSEDAAGPQDTAAENIDNPLVEGGTLALDSVDDEQYAVIVGENSHAGEDPLDTLLEDIDSGTHHETEIANEESSLNNDDAEGESKATIISQDEPLSFSDIISDDQNKDLSSLIQTTENPEINDVQHSVIPVPAEGGGAEGGQNWAPNESAQLDDLIAKSEIEP